MLGDRVRVGDKIKKYRYVTGTGGGTITASPDGKGTVQKIETGRWAEDCYSGHSGTFHVGSTRTLEWFVERDEDLLTKHGILTAPVSSKKVNEFPDFCTRCGQAAYVGLFEIAHRDEQRAANCPARRK